MDRLTLLDTLVALGLEIRVRKTKVVRNNQDAVIVIVNLGDDIVGEGDSPTTAMENALAQLKAKIESQAKRVQNFLDALNAASAPTVPTV